MLSIEHSFEVKLELTKKKTDWLSWNEIEQIEGPLTLSVFCIENICTKSFSYEVSTKTDFKVNFESHFSEILLKDKTVEWMAKIRYLFLK